MGNSSKEKDGRTQWTRPRALKRRNENSAGNKSALLRGVRMSLAGAEKTPADGILKWNSRQLHGPREAETKSRWILDEKCTVNSATSDAMMLTLAAETRQDNEDLLNKSKSKTLGIWLGMCGFIARKSLPALESYSPTIPRLSRA